MIHLAGQFSQAHLLVAVLGASSYTYAEATAGGKSFVACALAQKACRYRLLGTLYSRPVVFRDLDGAGRRQLARFASSPSRIDVLVIDDWAMASFLEPERRNFWERSARTVARCALRF
jgi:hypothetical protein